MKRKLRDIYKDMELAELIEKSQQDDRLALEELIKRNEQKVYNTLYHLDPNRTDISDIAQEVLFRMAKSIKNLKKPATFKFWLNQIITNLFYDELRRKTRRLNTISIDAPFLDMEGGESPFTLNIPDTEKLPEEKTLGSELDNKIKEAIENLPEQFRIVIVLRELQGLSYEEIAEITKTELGTVKSRLARARARLQEEIKPYLNHERGANE
ncbi:MAG TPA: sigma-70 family RNA polymerase sigma factor [Candidatus Gastranaerophilales bacterium]|nr:sigma-70 family RNA polymerase sigma factor [Candidatus Gastranaerophilales bacterium]